MANSKWQTVHHLKFAVCHLPFDLIGFLVDRGCGTDPPVSVG
jgi:hypothetical protein